MTVDVFDVVDPTYWPAARCAVCGGEIRAGEGLSLRYGATTVRLRCPDCLERFLRHPERYLEGHAVDCCHDAGDASPSSEWTCG